MRTEGAGEGGGEETQQGNGQGPRGCRRVVRSWVALVVVLASAASAAAAPVVNVLSAASLGCSPDSFTSPDLRVTVTVEGATVLQTAKAQDDAQPLYAAVGALGRAPPFEVTVVVEEAEPGGFLGLGTSWVLCDVWPGDGTAATFGYDGTTRAVTARGDGDRAALVDLVLGDGAPPAPRVSVTAGATWANVTWDADPSAQASGHRLALGGVGRVLAPVAAEAGTVRVDGLCDNQGYALRMIRDAAPWAVASEDVTFTTPNVPPAKPDVLAVQDDGKNLTVRWSTTTHHDLAAVEVHAGATAGFVPGADTLRASQAAPAAAFDSSESAAPRRAGDAYVKVRIVDSGGLAAVSEARAVGTSASETRATSASSCAPRVGASAHVPPSGDTTTGEDADVAPPQQQDPDVPDDGGAPPGIPERRDIRAPAGTVPVPVSVLVTTGAVVLLGTGVAIGMALRKK